MNTMDNAKLIEAIEKHSIQKYLEELSTAKMHKVTLFTVFPHTGAPNLSDPAYCIMVDDLSKIVGLNSGMCLN